MTKRLELGRIRRADEALEAAMFCCAIETLCEAGFEQYEISNFAPRHRRCAHNLLYWRNGNWLALGPGAAGHVDGLRWKNVPHLGRYLASRGGAPVQEVETLDDDAAEGERLMLGLRLIEGVANEQIESLRSAERLGVLDRLVTDGMLERTDSHTRLTERGLLVADSVIGELL